MGCLQQYHFLKDSRYAISSADNVYNDYIQLLSVYQLWRWIIEQYQTMKTAIVKQLHQSQGWIYLSFDLEKSRNMLALNGVVTHMVTQEGVTKTLLLALSEQTDNHLGPSPRRTRSDCPHAAG